MLKIKKKNCVYIDAQLYVQTVLLKMTSGKVVVFGLGLGLGFRKGPGIFGKVRVMVGVIVRGEKWFRQSWIMSQGRVKVKYLQTGEYFCVSVLFVREHSTRY